MSEFVRRYARRLYQTVSCASCMPLPCVSQGLLSFSRLMGYRVLHAIYEDSNGATL